MASGGVAAVQRQHGMGAPALPGEDWLPAFQHEQVIASTAAFTAGSDFAKAEKAEGESLDPMHALCRRVQFYLRPGDTVVDLSCGFNDWLPTLAGQCETMKFEPLSFRAFGSEPPPQGPAQRFFHFAEFSALSPAQLSVNSDNLVMGLCPPWGVKGTFAQEFMRKIAAFRPRVIALVCPPSLQLPPGYLLMDKHDKLFLPPAKLPRRIPGRVPDKDCYQFFLLQRRDSCHKDLVRSKQTGTPHDVWNPDPQMLGFRTAEFQALAKKRADQAAAAGPAS
jgi:hypothetical protein